MNRQPFLIILMVTALSLFCAAEEDKKSEEKEFRAWTARGGSTLEAKLVSQNSYQVVLEDKDGKKMRVAIANFSKKDQQFIKILSFKKYEVEDPPPKDYEWPIGEISKSILCGDDGMWSYLLFLPPNFNLSRKWPVMFVLSPDGGRPEVLERFKAGAILNEWIVAVSGQAKTGFRNSDAAMMAMVEDVEKKFPVDKKRMYVGGCAVGARIAWSLAVKMKDLPLTGMLACGAGEMKRDISPNTLLYGLCGSTSFCRWDVTCTFKKMKNNKSKLLFFPGADEWPPDGLLTDAMCWFNGFHLKKITRTDKLMIAQRYRYSKKVMAHLESFIEKDPERAYRLGIYLEEFKVHPLFADDLKAHMAKLRQMESIKMYPKAEKEMLALANKYFATDTMDFQNNNCPPALIKDANALADKYKDLKLSETIRNMGSETAVPLILF